MELVTSANEFYHIIRNFKKNHHKDYDTNFYMTKDIVSQLIEDGMLYIEVESDVVWIYKSNQKFYNAWFYSAKNQDFALLPKDKDIVVAILGNQERYDTKIENRLAASGFQKWNKNLEYVTVLKNHKEIKRQADDFKSYFERNGFKMREARKEDYEEMKKLCEDVIDRYAIEDFTSKEMKQIFGNGQSIVFMDKNEKIVATDIYLVSGKTILSSYIAVAPELNGKGLGAACMLCMQKKAVELGYDKILAWKWENNTASIRLTKRIAEPTGKFSQQFVLFAKG